MPKSLNITREYLVPNLLKDTIDFQTIAYWMDSEARYPDLQIFESAGIHYLNLGYLINLGMKILITHISLSYFKPHNTIAPYKDRQLEHANQGAFFCDRRQCIADCCG